MDSFVTKDGKQLRTGYTTGTCAAAASKAAALMLLSGKPVEMVRVQTPKGTTLNLKILDVTRQDNMVSCAVRKDSGDDPDVTDGIMIYSLVKKIKEPFILIEGGIGIGRVTKKGLDQPVGAAAINSVPRKMIKENLFEVCELLDYHEGLSVTISAPEGEKIAERTFNSRLGIMGGISILGTSGIVEPMSDQALIDTIRLELKQRKMNNANFVLLTPGNYGMDFLRERLDVSPHVPVMISNFIGEALDCCREQDFQGVLLVGHIGKLVKIAGNMLNTHSRYGDCRMELIAAHAAACGLDRRKVAEVLDCATCDDALRILKEENLFEETLSRLLSRITGNIHHRIGKDQNFGVIVFSNVYGILCETSNANDLLINLREVF